MSENLDWLRSIMTSVRQLDLFDSDTPEDESGPPAREDRQVPPRRSEGAADPAGDQITREHLLSGLTHEDFFVRSVCLGVFANGAENDPDVMRAVRSAIDEYGWEDAYDSPHEVIWLEPDAETVDWLVERRRREGPPRNAAERRLNVRCLRWLVDGPVELFPRWLEAFGIDPDGDDDPVCRIVRLRTVYSELEGPDALRLLREISEGCLRSTGFPHDSVRQMEYVCRRLAQLGLPDDATLRVWTRHEITAPDEPQIAEDYRLGAALFLMRHRGALGCPLASILRILDAEWEWLDEAVQEALGSSATAEELRSLLEVHPTLAPSQRVQLSRVFEKNRPEAIEEKLIEVYRNEPDPEVKEFLSTALALRGTPASMNAAREILDDRLPPGETRATVEVLYAYETLLGRESEELEGWRKELESERAMLRKLRAPDPETLVEPSSPPSENSAPGEFGKFAPGPFANSTLGKSKKPADRPAKAPYPRQTLRRETVVRESPKVGRNEPCPCGSGKKAKKCCL